MTSKHIDHGDQRSIVGFIDVMGFAAALEALSSDEFVGVENARHRGLYVPTLSPRAGQFLESYETFHRMADSQAEGLPLTMFVAFSDSVWVASSRVDPVTSFVGRLLFDCLANGIPARAGIAAGGLTKLTFGSRLQRPDAMRVECQFFGTAITRAYRAERCGLPGFRAFVHPSVGLSGPTRDCLSLPSEQQSSDCVQEINFLGGCLEELPSHCSRIAGRLGHLRSSVTQPAALRHYDAMGAVIDRMKAAQTEYLTEMFNAW